MTALYDRRFRICVFCGASNAAAPRHLEAARALGRLLATRSIGVVYGGASVGSMGALADGALEAGGEVFGVIPQTLVDRELAHRGLTHLHVVDSMHTRKAKMVSLADAFIALPGGFGTLDELFEVVTWSQLGLHDKPVGLVDTNGYYTKLAGFIEHAVAEGFIASALAQKLRRDEDASRLVDALLAAAPR